MKCNNAKDYIDQFVFGESDKLDLQTQRHIQYCESCRDYYQEGIKQHKLMNALQDNEPVIKNPIQLTDTIMEAIDESSQSSFINQELSFKSHQSKIINLVMFPRLVAAAVVLLMIVFGTEQYNVLNKINQLEERNQMISEDVTMQAQFEVPESFERHMVAVYKQMEDVPLDSIEEAGLTQGKSLKSLMALSRMNKTIKQAKKQINQQVAISWGSQKSLD